MIVIKQKGSFDNTEKFLKQVAKASYMGIFDRYGKQGVTALASATPTDSGLTANSWGYEIQKTPSMVKIIWTNSNIVDGVPIAVILQYGHATGNGGYVQGRDYINPVMQPLFNQIAEEAWKEVTRL